ncbi:MAG TPA: peptidoglycan DD-metalloendopeptidase family protein [Chitinophagaceae bacterium]|nr:peptidoglycan DD-metalloendopeptidase family protein [Chitinophagaceae bacterium]
MRIKNYIFIALLVFINFSISAQKTKNQSREQLESQRMSILEEIKRTSLELAELRKDKKASLSELQALQTKLSARQSLIANINNEINIIEENINLANKDVFVLKTQLDTLKKQYAEMVRYTYKNRTSSDMIVFLFSSSSFNDATRRLQYVKQYRSYRADQAVKIASAGKQLNNKITVLNQQKQKKDFVLMAQEQQNKILEAETAEKNRIVTQLKGKEKDLIVDLARKKKAAEDLNRAISSAIKKEIEIARKRAMEERIQQDKLRKMAAEKEKRMAQEKKNQASLAAEKAKRDEEARQLAIAKKQQIEKEKQALADKQRREDQERKLVQDKKEREAREQALAVERKKQLEAEKSASKLAESKRIEKERQLAIERKKQEETQRQLALEKQKQEDRQRQLMVEKQRQEEYQRQLVEDKKRQEREQIRLTSNQPYGNPRYVKTIAEKETPVIAMNKPSSETSSFSSNEASKPNVRTLEKDDYKFSLTPEERALTNNFEANKGKLPWPVEKGYVAEHFGKNKHPLFNVVTENYGVDIKTSVGASARAIYSGEVNSIINVPGMGQTVLINHGSFYTVYSKLSKVNVAKGSKVGMKQSIGTVSTDEDGNTLIHFEIWKVGANGQPFKVNPEQWVAQ